MKKIRKAIIPCGGMGTRFLPATKAIPKEILPIIDTPVLSYIVDELVDSGIEQIMIVLGAGKESIRDYFLPNERLIKALENKPELKKSLAVADKKVEIVFGMQKEPRGSGDAVMCARQFTGDEPFVMCNGDDLVVGEIPASKQLIDAYAENPALVIGVQRVAKSETDKYGIVKPSKIVGKTVWCESIVEKPTSNPPSDFAALGRYVLIPEIYERIERLPVTKGEVCLTDAFAGMMRDGKVYAYEFSGRRYDMGDKFGALTATVDFALNRDDLKDKFKSYITRVLGNDY